MCWPQPRGPADRRAARQAAAGKPCRGYAPDDDLAAKIGRHGQNERTIALGRKNWTFAGSDAGGHRAAAAYALMPEVGLAEGGGGGSRGFAPGKLAVKSALNERAAAARGSLALYDIAVSELPLSDFAQPVPLFIRLRNRDDAFLAVNRHRRIQCSGATSQILEKLPRGCT
jgi:hypothetical protein